MAYPFGHPMYYVLTNTYTFQAMKFNSFFFTHFLGAPRRKCFHRILFAGNSFCCLAIKSRLIGLCSMFSVQCSGIIMLLNWMLVLIQRWLCQHNQRIVQHQQCDKMMLKTRKNEGKKGNKNTTTSISRKINVKCVQLSHTLSYSIHFI